MIHREIAKGLFAAAWPLDRCAHGLLRLPESEEQFFTVLRKKSRSRLQHAGDLHRAGIDDHAGTDCIAIAFFSGEAKRNRRTQLLTTFLRTRSCGLLGD